MIGGIKMNINNLVKENQKLKQDLYKSKMEIEELTARNEKLELFYTEYTLTPLFNEFKKPKHL